MNGWESDLNRGKLGFQKGSNWALSNWTNQMGLEYLGFELNLLGSL